MLGGRNSSLSLATSRASHELMSLEFFVQFLIEDGRASLACQKVVSCLASYINL